MQNFFPEKLTTGAQNAFMRGAFFSICLTAISACAISACMSSHLLAEEVYNTLDSTAVNSWWGAGPLSDPSPDAGPDRTSQQFDLRGNHTVTEVALQLVRFGTPTGSLAFEIWEDDGFGYPGKRVGTLGTLEDVSTFEPSVETFDEFLALPNEATISFDTVVGNLNSEVPHHVVIDYSEASGVRTDGLNWGVSGGEEGAGPQTLAVTTEFPALTVPLDDGGFGATVDLFSPSGDWIRQSDMPVFDGAPPEVRFANFKMSVNAVPEPASSSIALFGLLGLIGLRKRR